jgi:hypothetical protein
MTTAVVQAAQDVVERIVSEVSMFAKLTCNSSESQT